jgi:hypothetical protein
MLTNHFGGMLMKNGTLANWTLIILFSKMLKFSKIISSKSKKYCEGK